ncbi:tetratricopeptide repeat protein [Dyella sp. A6]|uniref:tetratricopeptide repeat protein n=1 Tax=Dyella aluminiiresistens TaxID=3069105 RepID=UPI002E79E2DC|nr:tetratricopeptide repeat protein [Dyella sp. A6]
MQIRSHLLTFFAILLPISLAAYAYWPGLSGGYLFDDLGSLPALGAQGPVVHWHTFWRYITSGTADPAGRPLAMLTFLLDARNWPASPLPFKRTNLCIHLVNGLLLYALLTKLGELLEIERRRVRTAALLGCAFWLLHPLMVSTTLYIVQREAMLVATCCMAGLLLWIHGRTLLASNHLKAGTLWSMLGLGGFTLLGTLAKANGVLLPIYALLIEATVLASRQRITGQTASRVYQTILIAFGLIPATLVGTYLFYIGIHGIAQGGLASNRSWSYAQRLMTEPRVLMDYLQLLWLPRPFSSGLFNDQFTASTSLLSPITTVFALAAVTALIALAWWQRRHRPALALAVLFYFAGQLLESTSIPLELYFEHRNYTPALLMFWPLALWLTNERSLRQVKLALTVLLPLTLACMTYERASVWGNMEAQGLIWAKINPDSPRAQANAAEIEMSNGHAKNAVATLGKLLAAQPDQAQLAFNLIDAECMLGHIVPGTITDTKYAMLHTAATGTLFVRWFERSLPLAMSGHCAGMTPALLQNLINDGLKNRKLDLPGPRQDLTYLRGLIALREKHAHTAQADFTQALDIQVHPSFALQAAATLGSAGYPKLGLSLLNHYQRVQHQEMPPGFGMPMLHAWILKRQHYWPSEIAALQKQLNAATQHAETGSSHLDSPQGIVH